MIKVAFMPALQSGFTVHVPEHDYSYYTKDPALRGTHTHLVCYSAIPSLGNLG